MLLSVARLPPPIKFVISKAELLPSRDHLPVTSILNIAHVSSLIPPPAQSPIEYIWQALSQLMESLCNAV